ncbi:VacB/RNase II family 3'-5' exoribonuclease [Campylobacter sp. faydin G-105]|uniref:ribonuclease R family protein n=1 Tax=Campylobacter anatolicus TaxID=2829105 RepID=UPI001B94377C|nr:ribonuclease R family protein [Campylobacter anatolicus]MBR8461999.1 VacB/RNase II family 3'-5' exoribonuclease [Campylobacter anatolicus]
MKEFLTALLSGISEKEVSARNKEVLRNLLNLNAVSKYKNKFYLNDGFVCGKLDISSNGTGFLIPFDKRFKQDILIENKNLNNSHYGDIVLVKLLRTRKKRDSGKVIMSLKLASETSVVYTKSFGAAVLGVNLKTGLSLSLKASQKSLKALPQGTLLKINNVNNEIVEVLGNINDPFSDDKISLAMYNKNDKFSEICENEAAAWGDEVDPAMYPNRIDLQHLNFCTIDPIDAKDFDDAIYFDKGKNTIYVAIADVSEYVPPYSAIDSEAKTRGFSIYFPHIAVPMLPRALSENICSLKPNVPRLAFCFKISLDENGEVINEELFEAIILSKHRFNYDEIDEILNSPMPCKIEWLKPLFELTSKLRKKRLIKAFDFHTQELRMSLDDDGKVYATRFESDSDSHRLVEDCMLLANKAAAKRIKRGIFRNHASPDLKKINNLLNDLATLGLEFAYESDLANLIRKIQAKAELVGNREEIDKLIIKAQKKAEYASENHGHFGLGFERYTHFTSPIRRYSDLILHRLLKADLANDDKFYNYLLLNIAETCANLSELEREADKVSFDFMDRKFARWANENIGNTYECYIIENQSTLVAKLDDKLKGARIFIIGYTCELLQRVIVRIIEADIATAKIVGKVVAKLDKKSQNV